MKFKLKPKSVLLINILFAVILLGITADYFGYNLISNMMNTIVMLVILGVMGIEVGLLSLVRNPPNITVSSAGRYFIAIVFLLLSLVVVPPIFGVEIIGGQIAGTITMLGAILALLLAFT